MYFLISSLYHHHDGPDGVCNNPGRVPAWSPANARTRLADLLEVPRAKFQPRLVARPNERGKTDRAKQSHDGDTHQEVSPRESTSRSAIVCAESHIFLHRAAVLEVDESSFWITA